MNWVYMDHWLSLYTRIAALLEVLREREVTLKPSSLGALQSLVKFFCDRVCTASLDADLPPPQAITGLSSFSLQGWEKPGEKLGLRLDPIREESEEDALSIPDSLPDLTDSEGEEERPSPTGVVERGVVYLGLPLYQDSIRPHRFWVRC